MSEVIWKRPEGCTCQSVEQTDEAGQLSVIRLENPECLIHGEKATRIDAAVEAVMKYGRATPNATAFNEPNVRRLVRYITPFLLDDTTTNQ